MPPSKPLPPQKNEGVDVKNAAEELKTLKAVKEYPELVRRNQELEKENHELEAENASLKETRKTVGKGKLTLPDLRKRVAEIKNEEIQAEALRLFNEYKTSWEKEEKNREVADEACKITQAIVTIHQRNPDQRFYSKQWLQLDLPKKIADIMDDGIKKGIDTEFTRRVNSDAEKKAQTRLKELQSGEWPRWLKTHVEPTAELLRSRIITNAIEALKGPWLSTCNKCNSQM